MPRKKKPAHLIRPAGRPPTYPWATWFNGQTHMLEPGADFDCTPESLRRQIYAKASAENKKVQVRSAHNGLSVRVLTGVERTGSNGKYDWDLLLDGERHQLQFGRDIAAKPASFRVHARQVARDRQMRLITRTIGNIIILQATPRGEEAPRPTDLQPDPDLNELPFLIEDPLADPRPKL